VLMARLRVGWRKNLLYTVGFMAFIWLIFGKLFTIGLPSGVLEYLGL